MKSRSGFMRGGAIRPRPTLAPLTKGVARWPTHTATDNGPGMDKNNPRGVQQANALATAVNWSALGWWTAPTKAAVPEATGSLNPRWVEWLMGFPIGWTQT